MQDQPTTPDTREKLLTGTVRVKVDKSDRD